MKTETSMALHTKLVVAGAVLAMLAVGPCASASVVRINFSGTTGSGYADLTIAPDPNASSSYNPSQPAATPTLSQHDPAGASLIKGATGIFNGVDIVGIQPVSPGTPPALVADPSQYENLPASFSWLNPGATPSGSYDNLFYFGGSPWVCPPGGPNPYTFHGGFLDIFGVMFSLSNGNQVALWSDGFVPPGFAGTPGGLTFGMSLFEPAADGHGFTLSSTQFAGATAQVPEPRFMWLFGAGLVALFAWRRNVEGRKQVKRAEN